MILPVLAFASSPVAAQSFTSMGQVLTPSGSVSFASRSVGAPSITWDSINDQMIMVFESLTPEPTTGASYTCGKGVWALGMATSPDGINNWTIDPTVVVMPKMTANHPYACVAAHPSAVFTPVGNGRVQVYWKAESETDCTGTDHCEYTGVGRAVIHLTSGGAIDYVDIQTSSVLDFPEARYGGYPRVVKSNGDFYLALQIYPDIFTIKSNVKTTFNPDDRLRSFDQDSSDYDTYSWVTDEFMSPALICDGTDFELFVGSKNTDFGTTISGGLGLAVSDTTFFGSNFWALNASPYLTWTGDSSYRHFDAIKLASGDHLLYYSVKGGSGLSSIYLASTDTGFDLVDDFATYEPLGKICN